MVLIQDKHSVFNVLMANLQLIRLFLDVSLQVNDGRLKTVVFDLRVGLAHGEDDDVVLGKLLECFDESEHLLIELSFMLELDDLLNLVHSVKGITNNCN